MASSKKKSTAENNKSRLINMRLTFQELKQFQQLANQYTNGNVSQLIRYAVERFHKPKTI